MNVILQFIADYAVECIVILGVVIALLLLVNGLSLSNQKNRIYEALERRNKKYAFKGGSKEIEETDDDSATITPDTIRKYETEFNKICSRHSVLIQFIPIFPLLGILGTVAGLMLQMQSSDDIVGMMASMDVALETTLFGLIFAIVLKGIEAVFPSRVIYEVDVMLDDFDKKMSLAEMFENYKDK